MGRVNEYAAWAGKLDFVEVTDAELDNATYESAQKQQMDGNQDAAIRQYKSYVEGFPHGLHAVNANFNLAQLYFAKGDKEAALPHYVFVAERTSSEYAEQALTRVCEIHIGRQAYAEAMPYLRKLEAQANIQQNRIFAQSNLMKGYYGAKDYGNTLAYAEKVLAIPAIDDRIKSDAQIMIARSALATGNTAKAENAYGQVLTIASGETAAEACITMPISKTKTGRTRHRTRPCNYWPKNMLPTNHGAERALS